jgi:hypothetical protein
MINTFLKAKNWQLFLVLCGIPYIAQFVFMGSTIVSVLSQSQTGVSNTFPLMTFFSILMFAFLIVFFGWFWSMGIGLQKKVPQDVSLKTTTFKIFFFVPLVYLMLISVAMLFSFNGIMDFENLDSNAFAIDPSVFLRVFAIILPIHLFSMFCMFYMIYFIARTIKTIELKRKVVFEDYIAEFFLLWFFPIGIWILQPKINKMVEAN